LDVGQHVVFGVSGIVMGTLNSFQHFLLPPGAADLQPQHHRSRALLAPSLGIYAWLLAS